VSTARGRVTEQCEPSLPTSDAIGDNEEIKLMKGKALREHSLHEKTAASVLLKLFISSNE